MTSNTCNICDPITKYDISSDDSLVRDQEGNILEGDIDSLILDDSFRFSRRGDISSVEFEQSDDFEIPNPTEEKLLAREVGRKPSDFRDENPVGDIPVGPDISALIEKGIYLPDSSFSDISSDRNLELFDEILKTLCCVTSISLNNLQSSTRNAFSERVRRFSTRTGIDLDKSTDFWTRVLSAPFSVREGINKIVDANIPVTQINSTVSGSCLIQQSSPRTLSLSSGPNAVPLDDSYVNIFLTETNFRKLAGMARGFYCERVPTSFTFSNISNSFDSTRNKFNNPNSALDSVSSCFSELLSAISQLVLSIIDYGTGGKSEHITQIGKLPSVLSALENFITTLLKCLQDLLDLQIPKLREIINIGQQIKAKAVFAQKYGRELNDITNLAEPNPLFGDITNMLSSIKSKLENIIELVSEMITKVGAFSFSGADPTEYVENRDPGSMLGNFLSGIVLGQSIPTQKQSNNPLLKDPSYSGKAFFGEAAISLPAIDQVFSKRVAMFQEPSGAAAASSFNFQNTDIGRSTTLSNSMARILTNTQLTSLTGRALSEVNTITNDISNLLGANINSSVELNRADNAIPVMIALSSRISGDTFCPFETRIFTEGWKRAAYARSKIENINPNFFERINEST